MYHNNLVHAKVSNFHCVLKIVVSWKMYNSWLEIKETCLGVNVSHQSQSKSKSRVSGSSFESG